MDIRRTSLAFVLAACLAPGLVMAGGPSTTGALATPANRIVGLWSNLAMTGACNGGTPSPGRQTLLFIAGGSFIDNPRISPNGIGPAGAIRQRSLGIGTWSYDPDTAQYSLDQQFDWYLNGAYDGYQTVHRSIVLSGDGNTASGPVLSVRYDAAGNPTSELCGNAVSNRL